MAVPVVVTLFVIGSVHAPDDFYGAFAAKRLIIRSSRLPGWALPLATLIVVMWYSGALWYFAGFHLPLPVARRPLRVSRTTRVLAVRAAAGRPDRLAPGGPSLFRVTRRRAGLLSAWRGY